MKRLILWLILVTSACQFSGLSPTALPTTYPSESIPTRVALTAAAVASPTQEVIPSPALTSIPQTLAPGPYGQYYIDSLRRRTYGGGAIEIVETMEDTAAFTRYRIHYPSDGLNIYGFADVPKGAGPFPIVIVIHGLADPATYQTLDYTTPAADTFAQNGYIVIHPDLRGYPPSDSGDNLFRVGMAVDVLNLIALIKSKSGPSDLFANAWSDHIGLWGHSLGGNIALRVLTISSDIKATVLYAPLSGDEMKNAELLSTVSPGPTFQTELATPPAIFKRISPLYYYKDITSPIQLYQGTADQVVPIAWGKETCSAATAAGIQIKCVYYPRARHTFRPRLTDQFLQAAISFYKKHLSR